MKFSHTLLAILYTAASCTKHAGDYKEETPAAALVISLPINNQLYKATDSIRINAFATATAVIHGYDAYLTRQSDTVRLQSVSVHDHNDTLVIDRIFAPLAGGKYEAHILLTLDHDGHTLHKYVSFKTE